MSFERFEEVAQILEQCLAAIEQDGQSVEDCLARYPAYRLELEPLLRRAAEFRLAHGLQPTAVFRDQAAGRLQSRLMRSSRQPMSPAIRKPPAARHQGQRGRSPLFRRLAMLPIALAILVILAGTSAGVVYASDSTVPGDTLHGLDLAVEQAQLNLAEPDQTLGLHIQFADERILEAETLVARDDRQHLDEALNDYEQEASDITGAIGTEDDLALLEQVEAAFSRHEARLMALLDKLPEQARGGINRALEASEHGRQTAEEARSKKGGSPPCWAGPNDDANDPNCVKPGGKRP